MTGHAPIVEESSEATGTLILSSLRMNIILTMRQLTIVLDRVTISPYFDNGPNLLWLLLKGKWSLSPWNHKYAKTVSLFQLGFDLSQMTNLSGSDRPPPHAQLKAFGFWRAASILFKKWILIQTSSRLNFPRDHTFGSSRRSLSLACKIQL